MSASAPAMSLSIRHPTAGSVAAGALMPLVSGAVYVESLDALDALVLTITPQDTDAPERADLPYLLPGGVLTLSLLDGGEVKRTVPLDVVTARHSRPHNGRRAVQLTALEPLQRLRGLSVSAVAAAGGELLKVLTSLAKTALGGSAGNTGSPDTGPLGVTVFDRPLLGALKRAARQRGLTPLVEIGSTGTPKLVFESLDRGDALRVPWGQALLSAELTMDLSQQVSGVEVYGLPDPTTRSQADRDPAAGKAPRGPATPGTTNGAALIKGWGVDRVHVVEAWSPPGDQPGEVKSEAARTWVPSALSAEAARVYGEIARRFVRGRVSARGLPLAVKNGALTLVDAPWPYNCSLYINEVRHDWSLDGGLHTELGFEADAVARP